MSEHHQALSATSGASLPDDVSHFLRLPGELRNRIYELVLTLPDKTIQYVTKGVFQPSSNVVSSIADTPQIVAITTQESTTSELVHHQKNQLQYVCKGLHQETHWLELKFNSTIIFRSEGHNISATEQFFHFFAMVPAEKRTWIQTVELHSGTRPDWLARRNESRLFSDSRQTLRSLADLCRYHPFVAVKYRLVLFSSNSSLQEAGFTNMRHALFLGAKYHAEIRHHILDDLWPESLRDEIVEEIKRYKNRSTVTSQDVARFNIPNLRFFPKNIILTEQLLEYRGTFFQDDALFKPLMPLWSRLSEVG